MLSTRAGMKVEGVRIGAGGQCRALVARRVGQAGASPDKSDDALGQVIPPTILQTVQKAAEQYGRAAPLLDWLIAHPLIAVTVFIGAVSGAAMLGSFVGSSEVVERVLKRPD